jgi:hypothetical protein
MMTPKKLSAGICTGTLWLILLLAALPNTSRADCSCVCVEGAVQAACDNNVEPRPMCGPTLCAPAPATRLPEPLVANPGRRWLHSSPSDTKIGEDTYEWIEVGEEPEDSWDW